MSTVCFEGWRVVRALAPAVILVLASCGGNGSDTNTSAGVSSNAGNRFLASQSVPLQGQVQVPITESIVGLLTLIRSQPVLVGTDSSFEIQYIVNGLPSPVSSFQLEYADSGLPIEASGCQILMLQSLF